MLYPIKNFKIWAGIWCCGQDVPSDTCFLVQSAHSVPESGVLLRCTGQGSRCSTQDARSQFRPLVLASPRCVYLRHLGSEPTNRWNLFLSIISSSFKHLFLKMKGKYFFRKYFWRKNKHCLDTKLRFFLVCFDF